jgi:lipoprotein signal peptidase
VAEFSRHFRVIVGVAAAVLLVDFVTKEIALAALSHPATGESAGFMGFSFALLLNDGTAGGFSLGDNTRLINLASMSSVVLLCSLVWKPVSAMHNLAPIAFGLITGAALGNTLSLLLAPAVVDFIAYGSGDSALVFNVADIAVVAGVVLLVPPAVVLASRVRASYADVVRPLATRSVREPRLVFDREVPIALASEVSLEPEVRQQNRVPGTLRPDVSGTDPLWTVDDGRSEPRV